MRTVDRSIVAGLVISKEGKLLFGMKDPDGGGVYADAWHTPGGGVEVGETELKALAREMREEMGINITEAKVSLLDNEGSGEAQKTLRDTGETVHVRMKFNVYKIQYDRNANDIDVTPGDDIVRFTWVDPKDLKDYKLTPPSVELFKRLGWL